MSPPFRALLYIVEVSAPAGTCTTPAPVVRKKAGVNTIGLGVGRKQDYFLYQWDLDQWDYQD